MCDLIAVGKEPFVQHFQHAHPIAVSLDVSLALQRQQVLVDRGRRPHPQGLTDLANRRDDAVTPNRRGDVLQDLPLPVCQWRSHSFTSSTIMANICTNIKMWRGGYNRRNIPNISP